MKRIAWLTDPHTDHFAPEVVPDLVAPAIRALKPDAVLITGDISGGDRLLIDLAALPTPRYFVLGNHDFYRSDFGTVRRSLQGDAGYLENVLFVPLTPATALVGVDGWYDCAYGNWHDSVILNDWKFIGDFRGMNRTRIRSKCALLAIQAGERLRECVAAAVAAGYKQVLVATHVPPFAEASRGPGGVPANNQWLPVMASKEMATVLLSLAGQHPDVQFLVLCGHTHTAWTHAPRPNLTVMVGAASHEYDDPLVSLRTLDIA